MGPETAEWLADMRSLLDDARNQAEDTGYGVFPGGDPRTFTPDPEASTEEERAAHKADCERAERGEPAVTKTACEHIQEGDVTIHIMRAGYGLGMYTMGDPAMSDIAERLERIMGMVERDIRQTEGDGE